jgi:hypothetical protein
MIAFLRSFSVCLVWLLLLPSRATAAVPAAWDVDSGRVANGDYLAWSLVGVLVISLSMVGFFAWGLYRQGHPVTPEQRLLEELKEQLRQLPASQLADSAVPASPPWERPADWWKNPSED